MNIKTRPGPIGRELGLEEGTMERVNVESETTQSAITTSVSTTSVSTEPASPEPMLVLLDAARRIECRLEEALAAVGLSIAKYQALDVLVTAGAPTRLSALAGSLDCVRSNVTQLADRLESDGLIQRVASPDDRRAVHAVVTTLGRTRHAAGAAAIRALQSELAACVAPADRASFHRVLSALR